MLQLRDRSAEGTLHHLGVGSFRGDRQPDDPTEVSVAGQPLTGTLPAPPAYGGPMWHTAEANGPDRPKCSLGEKL